ncbi:winged helix-turn-helix domain-containing protein [Runella sp.]|jgi:DNA-binding transcriptional regulator YhcF (GntR family)|uniref:GntR family transcriptional regulator n=1 Tax=Runella sp. TaxID=1960881 RepID=UPI002636285E|nr:winged helix-turn-helix domain-containing protein [Runella sp.]
MKRNDLLQLITIDCYSATPKYLQIANSILTAIGKGELEKDEILPSINELSFESDISRDTAEKGYKYLKKIGMLDSVPGKGYFVKSTIISPHPKILLLANKLNAHKKSFMTHWSLRWEKWFPLTFTFITTTIIISKSSSKPIVTITPITSSFPISRRGGRKPTKSLMPPFSARKSLW